MIHLNWRLMDALKEYNIISEDNIEAKDKAAKEVINKLNKEINERRTSEIQVVKEWLNKQISNNFVLNSSVQVTSVPSICEGYCDIEKRDFLEHIELFQSCRRILDYLEREERKKKNEHIDR